MVKAVCEKELTQVFVCGILFVNQGGCHEKGRKRKGDRVKTFWFVY